MTADEPRPAHDADAVGRPADAEPAGQAQRAVAASCVEALTDAIDAAVADAGVRVIVIAGAGRAFCAGYDLTEEAEGAIGGPVELARGSSPSTSRRRSRSSTARSRSSPRSTATRWPAASSWRWPAT